MVYIQIFKFNPIQENTYVIYNDSGNALLIDAGCYFSAEQEMLKNFISEKKLTISQLINTHCHLDHVFGNKWVHDRYGVELFMHPDDEKVFESAPDSGLRFGLPFENYDGPLHYLHESDKVKLNNDEFLVLHTPGHSPGSICLYNEANNFIIAGDVLFKNSIGRTDIPLGYYETLIQSIKEKLLALPDNTTVYPGHGSITTIGEERLNNPFL